MGCATAKEASCYPEAAFGTPLHRTVLLVLAFIAPMAGCAARHSYGLEPIDRKGVEIRYIDGDTVAFSMKSASSVGVFSAVHAPEGEFFVQLVVSNLSKRDISFREDRDVAAALRQPDKEPDEPIDLYVFSASEYLDVVASRQARQANAAAWGNAFVVAASGRSTSSTTTTANVSGSGPGGRYYGSGTSTSTTTYTDPVAQAQAGERARQNMTEIYAAQHQKRQSLETSLMKRETLAPGENLFGWVVVQEGDRPLRVGTEDRVLLWVKVGEDSHFFVLVPTDN